MSMSPNDPFDQPENAQVVGQAPPQTRRGSKGCLIGCSIAGLLGLLICCGGGYLMTQFGVSMLASEYQQQLQGNPVIVEHIGEIESLEPSWSATIQEAQNADGQGDEPSFAFDIKGTKGSGTLLVRQDKSGDGMGMESATLVMPDGSRHVIETSSGPPELEEIDANFDDLIDTGDAVTEPEPVEAQQD